MFLKMDLKKPVLGQNESNANATETKLVSFCTLTDEDYNKFVIEIYIKS